MRIIAGFNALVFILSMINPAILELLVLDPAAIKRGEVWRLVSYIFIPQVGGEMLGFLFAALYIWYLMWLGDGLEQAMGSFRLNLFYLLGMIGTTVAAFFAGSHYSSATLNASLFFAFARYFPDMMIYLFFVLPVKVKWMAWVSAAFLLLEIVTGTWMVRITILAVMANYLIFFGQDIVQEAAMRREVAGRRKRFEAARDPGDEPLHRCTTCGRTDVTAPELEFRVSKNGEEYCAEHLPKPAA